ncbi:MAG: ParA family protein, partial [Planctomycetota bacterium]
KGGVGKTTTAINMAAGLAKAEQKTLLVDMDPQCNATSGMGKTPTERHPLIEPDSINEAMQKTQANHLQLLPGSRSFLDVDRLANSHGDLTRKVEDHLKQLASDFDFVILDCPPSLGALTQNALACSNEILMPIQCEYFAMEGLTQMISLIKEIIQSKNSNLEFGGILLTMFDETLELTSEVESQVRDFFGGVVFDTVIPRDVAVSEAPSHGHSVLDYSPRSRGSRAYTELCMEVMQHE